jgi:hypothetical protein
MIPRFFHQIMCGQQQVLLQYIIYKSSFSTVVAFERERLNNTPITNLALRNNDRPGRIFVEGEG